MVSLKQKNLKNGVRVVAIPLKGLKSVTVEVFVKIGSKYERPGEFGLSHFLEHMAFKGTEKRPRSVDISNEIDSKGAGHNAFTSNEYTGYYITTINENLDWALEMISDILFNSVFKEDEVEKERGVIIEEMRMYQDNPMMGLCSDFVKFMYQGSSGCWNIIGEAVDINCTTRKILTRYRSELLSPKNMVVVIAGDVKEDDINLVEKYFEEFANEKAKDLDEVKVKLNQENDLVKKKEIEQGHFCIGVPALPWTDDRKHILRILDLMLSGYSSSRLYNKIREENAWAYYVFSISESFKETGFLGVQSGVRIDKLDEAVELVKDEMVNLGRSVKEAELNRAKEYLAGKTQLAMDRSDFWSNFVGERLLLEDKLQTPDDDLVLYSKVILNDIQKLANELLTKEKIRSLTIRS